MADQFGDGIELLAGGTDSELRERFANRHTLAVIHRPVRRLIRRFGLFRSFVEKRECVVHGNHSDVKALELCLAIIDDRFERLACRPDDPYQDWRRDTITKIRAIAARAQALQDAGDLEAHHRNRVAALRVTVRRRVEALDERHAAFRVRRVRRAWLERSAAAVPV